VLDLLPDELVRARPVPVGRLDFFSEGLLLLTTDGDLTHRLTHPSHHMPKVYHLLVRGPVGPEKLEAMREGMTLAEGEQLAPVEAKVLESKDNKTLLELVLVQGVNRQIRRMCRDLDLTVLRLSRVAQGPLRLGELPSGKWRRLHSDEVLALRRAVGLD
jgi:23S rRNA pseudouridine2605 synthase